MVTKKDIEKVLKSIPDPEIGVSLWDLGLIYKISITKSGVVSIMMTLTSIGCPLFNLIADPIKDKVGKMKGVKKINIDLTFDPPWSIDKMTAKGKAAMGFT